MPAGLTPGLACCLRAVPASQTALVAAGRGHSVFRGWPTQPTHVLSELILLTGIPGTEQHDQLLQANGSCHAENGACVVLSDSLLKYTFFF